MRGNVQAPKCGESGQNCPASKQKQKQEYDRSNNGHEPRQRMRRGNHSRLPLLEFVDALAMRANEEIACALGPIARDSLEVLRQGDLMREVVVDHPLAPHQLKPIPIKSEEAEHSLGFLVRGRRGVK